MLFLSLCSSAGSFISSPSSFFYPRPTVLSYDTYYRFSKYLYSSRSLCTYCLLPLRILTARLKGYLCRLFIVGFDTRRRLFTSSSLNRVIYLQAFFLSKTFNSGICRVFLVLTGSYHSSGHLILIMGPPYRQVTNLLASTPYLKVLVLSGKFS